MSNPTELLKMLNSEIAQEAANLKQLTEKTRKTYQRTSLIIRLSIGTMTFMLIGILYFLFFFSQNVSATLNEVKQMYLYFGELTEEIQIMSGSVHHMSDKVKTLPQMHQQMAEMQQNMNQMRHHLSAINQQVEQIEIHFGQMNQQIHQLSQTFTPMSHKVETLQWHIHQASKVMP